MEMKIDINGLSANEVRDIVERLRLLKLESYISRLECNATLQVCDACASEAKPQLFSGIYSIF